MTRRSGCSPVTMRWWHIIIPVNLPRHRAPALACSLQEELFSHKCQSERGYAQSTCKSRYACPARLMKVPAVQIWSGRLPEGIVNRKVGHGRLTGNNMCGRDRPSHDDEN